MHHSNRIEIVSQILEDAKNGGATRTQIGHETSLSYTKLKEYLAMLVDNGLLDYEIEEQFFRTSEKGYRFLQVYGNNQIEEHN
jgi:predicted transcriptional regulator